MPMLFRRGTGPVDFRDATERDYFSFHLEVLSIKPSVVKTAPIYNESNVNAKLGGGSSQRQTLRLRRNLEKCLILKTEAGWRAQPLVTLRIRSCYALDTRDKLENRYRKDTVLFETASDHLLMAGFAGGCVMYFVLHKQTWQQVYSGVIIRFEIVGRTRTPGPSACSPQ